MTTTERPASSLTRDLVHALRYYLGNWRALLILATILIVTGLVLNWNWLVAVGLAPILLSTLPCLVMCAFGVCMMCRSAEKQSTPVSDKTTAATPPATLAVTTENPSSGTASCCPGQTNEANPHQMTTLQSNEERKASHA